MKKLMEIIVHCTGNNVVQGHRRGIGMVAFHAETDGPLFKGKTLDNCVDTQTYLGPGSMTLSARYMLEGVDCDGKNCRIFIENNGTDFDNCKPTVTTDSDALAFLEEAELTAKVIPLGDGVCVSIYG